MANAIYPFGKAEMMRKNIDMETDDIRLILIDTASYSYNANNKHLNDIPGGARQAVSSNLTGKSVSDLAAFDSDDKTFPAVPAGPNCEAIIGYQHTGTESTSTLLFYIDTGVGGLPITPDGSDIKITVDTGGWFFL